MFSKKLKEIENPSEIYGGHIGSTPKSPRPSFMSVHIEEFKYVEEDTDK